MKKAAGRLKHLLIGFSVFLFILALAGTLYQTAGAEADRRNLPAPGHLIDVGGFKMHISCMGEGSPTVILETLSGGTSSYWGWIQSELAGSTRVCVYDRAGRGWSEPDPQPITLARTVRNLRTLLTNARIEGPYLLVGHSIGGIYIRQFAADYPEQVAGIVLMDASHPLQYVRYPDLLKENESYLQQSSAFPLLARLGVFRLYFSLGGEIDFAEMKEPQKSEIQSIWSSSEYFESQRAEIIAGSGIFMDGQHLGRLDDLPLLVITAGPQMSSPWCDLQTDLASLSDDSVHLFIESATHASLVLDPEDAHQVSLSILKVLDGIQTGRRLDAVFSSTVETTGL